MRSDLAGRPVRSGIAVTVGVPLHFLGRVATSGRIISAGSSRVIAARRATQQCQGPSPWLQPLVATCALRKHLLNCPGQHRSSRSLLDSDFRRFQLAATSSSSRDRTVKIGDLENVSSTSSHHQPAVTMTEELTPESPADSDSSGSSQMWLSSAILTGLVILVIFSIAGFRFFGSGNAKR